MGLWWECAPPWDPVVASLELDPQFKRYRLRFRFGGRSLKRSLGTTSKSGAIAALVRFEETHRLVESGLNRPEAP